MKEFFISECGKQENKVITSSFVVASKQDVYKRQPLQRCRILVYH